MRRFEVWRLTTQSKQGEPRLVMILQSEKIDHLASVVVAPLKPDSADAVIPNLTPMIRILNTSYTVLIPFLSSIERRSLHSFVFDGTGYGYEIDRAMDRLFLGI